MFIPFIQIIQPALLDQKHVTIMILGKEIQRMVS